MFSRLLTFLFESSQKISSEPAWLEKLVELVKQQSNGSSEMTKRANALTEKSNKIAITSNRLTWASIVIAICAVTVSVLNTYQTEKQLKANHSRFAMSVENEKRNHIFSFLLEKHGVLKSKIETINERISEFPGCYIFPTTKTLQSMDETQIESLYEDIISFIREVSSTIGAYQDVEISMSLIPNTSPYFPTNSYIIETGETKLASSLLSAMYFKELENGELSALNNYLERTEDEVLEKQNSDERREKLNDISINFFDEILNLEVSAHLSKSYINDLDKYVYMPTATMIELEFQSREMIVKGKQNERQIYSYDNPELPFANKCMHINNKAYEKRTQDDNTTYQHKKNNQNVL